MTKVIKKVSKEKLIQTIVDNLDGSRKKFAFLLGAGASVSSNIPAANTLAEKWFKELENCDLQAYQAFKEKIKNNDFSAHYSEIFRQRFEHDKADGYHEIEKIITDKKVSPSLGYVILGSFLLETDNNIIITTNFDRLSETALLTVFNEHAKVIYHENMLEIMTLDNKKPTILKIHNDVFFHPKNAQEHISSLSDAWKKKIDEVLGSYHLVVLGYAGNDAEGLMQYLVEKDNSNRIYWCYREEKNIPDKVSEKGFACVKIAGFDEFMFALNQSLPEERSSNLKKIQEKIRRTAEDKSKQIGYKMTEIVEKIKSDNFIQYLHDLEKFVANTWWDFQLKIKQETDIEKQDALYQKGLEQFPESYQLMGNYANFLKNIRKKYDKAEVYYKKALELDFDHANNNSNYALFLHTIRKDYAQAEGYYKKALELDSDYATYNSNYAVFLHLIRKDYEQAEGYYKKALEFDPEHVNSYGNYAIFLNDIRKDYDQAEVYYKKALELDSESANNNGNYANFLKNIRKDYAQAEVYYKKALELDSESAIKNGNYAQLLHHIRKNYAQAEGYYKKALELDSESANNNGNYAWFLHDIRKDYEQAEGYYKKALELDSESANVNGNYANFLKNIRKDYDKAEEYYKKALKLDSESATCNGNYAAFLHHIRKNYAQAEGYYKKALELDSDDATYNSNYAGFLLAQGRTQQAISYLEKAEQEADLDDLKIELLFYRVAHFPESYSDNKPKLERLINQGVRSIGWIFDDHIEQAKKAGHPHIDELVEWAKIITTDEVA